MLATEIELKCFHEKLQPSNESENGWTSWTKVAPKTSREVIYVEVARMCFFF